MKREYSLLAATVLLCWVVTALLASPVHAVSEITMPGTPFPVATTTSDEIDSDVAYNATDNEYLLVWEHDFYVDHDIVARRVASDGSLLGSGISIGTSPDHDINPQLAYNSSANEYLAVWEYEYAAGDHDIIARRVASDGSLLGSVIEIGTSLNHEINPQLAYNSSANEYLAVWEYEYAADDHDIVARRVASDGSLLGSVIEIGTSLNHEINPQVAYAPATYLVVWEYEYVAADHDIVAQWVRNDGSLLGSVIAIGTSPNHDINPRVASNSADNECLVLWEYEYAAADHDIYGVIPEPHPLMLLVSGSALLALLAYHRQSRRSRRQRI